MRPSARALIQIALALLAGGGLMHATFAVTSHKPKEIVVVGSELKRADKPQTPSPSLQLKPAPGALPELPGFKPDLIPLAPAPMSAKVGVKNIGNAKAGASVLTIECNKRGQQGGCAESRAMARYIDPAYPNKIVVKIPPLAPGQSYYHVLAFWAGLAWAPGTYVFTFIADDGNKVAESNEINNKKETSLNVP